VNSHDVSETAPRKGQTKKKNFGRSTSATLLCVVWRRFDRLELIAFRVCGEEEPGSSCGRTKCLPRALLSHHKLLGNLFWIFGLNLERAVSSSERILCSRAPNLGVLCTPDRPPPFVWSLAGEVGRAVLSRTKWVIEGCRCRKSSSTKTKI